MVCPNGGPYWARQTPTRLLAKETRKYLATNRRFTFGNPIQGQLEVHAKASPDADTEWLADVCGCGCIYICMPYSSMRCVLIAFNLGLGRRGCI